MAKRPTLVIAPPGKSDEGLKDFSAKIQRNFAELFQGAHEHLILDSPPTTAEGTPGDVYLVNGTTKQLYIRFATGWFYVNLTAA